MLLWVNQRKVDMTSLQAPSAPRYDPMVQGFIPEPGPKPASPRSKCSCWKGRRFFFVQLQKHGSPVKEGKTNTAKLLLCAWVVWQVIKAAMALRRGCPNERVSCAGCCPVWPGRRTKAGQWSFMLPLTTARWFHLLLVCVLLLEDTTRTQTEDRGFYLEGQMVTE